MKLPNHRLLRVIPFITLLTLVVLYTATGCNLLKQDFKGGTECLMQVEIGEAVRRMTLEAKIRLILLLKENEVVYSKISMKDRRTINIQELSAEDISKAKEILGNNFAEWDFEITDKNIKMSFKEVAEIHVKDQATFLALEVIKKRLKSLGLKREYIKRESPDSNLLKLRLPPAKNQVRIMGVIRMVGRLEFRQVIEGPFVSKEEALKTLNGELSEDLDILRSNPQRMNKGFFVVKAYPVITGKDLKEVSQKRDEYGMPRIDFTLTSSGASAFGKYTAANIGKKLAIVLDNEIQSAPVVESVISDAATITGKYTVEEAEDLVLVLKSGGLPAPIKILEERIIK
jgi:preprotein translocase subunit SecD